jgi:hypothetical protein
MRFKGLLIAGVVVLVVGIGAWFAHRTVEQAHIDTAYIAKLACTCLFVSHRPIQSCAADYDMPAVKLLTEEVGNQTVTVSALGHLISTRAVFEQGYGCHLVN